MSERTKRDDGLNSSYIGASDSEDDFSSAFGNENDALDNYNVSDKLKNLLRMGNFRLEESGLTQIEDESDDDSIRPIREIEKSLISDSNNNSNNNNENKYMNFPLRPVDDGTITEKKKKKVDKLKRREKEKEKKKKKKTRDDILEQPPQKQRRDVHDFLERLRQEQSDEEEEEFSRKRRSGARKTRKNRDDLRSKVDENGERLVRETELLNSSSDDSDDDRPMSKREEMEMYRQRERMLRATEVKIKPTINIKSYEDFIKRREQREQEKRIKKEQEQAKMQAQHDSDSDDLEIIYNSKLKITSPDRPKYPFLAVSPVRNAETYRREHNAMLLKKLYEQTQEHRKQMEEAAKAKGNFVSAVDRAKKLIEQEKRAQIINEQVEKHFKKKSTLFSTIMDEDDEDEDEDYKDDEQEDDQEDEQENDETNEQSQDDDNNNDKQENNKKIDDNNMNTDADQHDMEETDNHRRVKRVILSDSEESDNDETSSPRLRLGSPGLRKSMTSKPKPKEKNDYVVEEAEEEEDEFFGMGGPDIEETEDLDQYEQDGVLVEHNEDTENVDNATLRAMFK